MDAPTPVLSKSGAYYFSCQEELKLDREFFTEDEGFITFTLTEHYPDGSCEVKRELKLGYKHGALGTIEFFK